MIRGLPPAAFLRRQRLGLLLSWLALALGVALGVAVSVVNRAAVDAFAQGVARSAGSADLQLLGPRGGFDETLFARVSATPGVAFAAPVIELKLQLPGAGEPLRLLGVDPFRLARLQPALQREFAAPSARAGGDGGGGLTGVWLSPAAQRSYGLAPGQSFVVSVAGMPHRLQVAGSLRGAGEGALALADIAEVQWHLGWLGRLSRIDVRAAEGVTVAQLRRELEPLLPPGVLASTPQEEVGQAQRLSRAYRVNLSLLAVLALATGAFLVFATQALSVARRRSEFALLRALGLTRGELLRGVLAEALALGLAGGCAGLLLGYGLAALALRWLGGDLGAGYFSGVVAQWRYAPAESLLFVALGVAAAVGGAWWPARDAAAADPARALHAGDALRLLARAERGRTALALLVLGLALPFAPPIAELPVAGYASIACLLAAAVLGLPLAARLLLARLPRLPDLPAELARAQLAGAPSQVAIAAGGVLASVALASSMAIMVCSFRHSVEVWLGQILPADLYVRSAQGGVDWLEPALQAQLAALPGVRRVELLRYDSLRLGPGAPVTLIARSLPPQVDAALPLVARATPVPGVLPVWVSEAVVDLHGLQVGARLQLPLAGRAVPVQVAGVWRDYARQTGALIVRLEDWRGLSGDLRVNDAALHLAPGGNAEALEAQLRTRYGGRLAFARPAQIRRESLRIFDRTFAVTYALEACAVLIGLFGVAASFGALAAARQREFGVLRHLGMTRGEIGRMLAAEGALAAAVGAGAGLLCGGALSVVLVRVVNRQSFHWSMDLAPPWGALALFLGAVVLLAALAARLAAAGAMHTRAVGAVREDW